MENKVWIIDFAKSKNTSRQTVYAAVQQKKLDGVKKYGTTFIQVNEKAQNWIPKARKTPE